MMSNTIWQCLDSGHHSQGHLVVEMRIFLGWNTTLLPLVSTLVPHSDTMARNIEKGNRDPPNSSNHTTLSPS